MAAQTSVSFTTKQATDIGNRIGIDWDKVDFPVEEFRMGCEVEVEHGPYGPDNGEATNIGDSEEGYGMVSWAHLKELPDYYTRLLKMEQEGKKEL